MPFSHHQIFHQKKLRSHQHYILLRFHLRTRSSILRQTISYPFPLSVPQHLNSLTDIIKHVLNRLVTMTPLTIDGLTVRQTRETYTSILEITRKKVIKNLLS